MKIRQVQIRNFRGIESLNWVLPEVGVVCLIGGGDLCKSTILEAIRLCLLPSWNVAFDTFDFFDGMTQQPIEIILTLGDLPAELITERKYGHWIRGWKSEDKELVDEPRDDIEKVLSLRLSVDESLEPIWEVFSARMSEGRRFGMGDREKANMAFIGDYVDRHLTWSRNSILKRGTSSDSISASLNRAARSASVTLEKERASVLGAFDQAAGIAEKIAKKLGVPVSKENSFKARLDTGALNLKLGDLALHDDNLPLRTLGTGSKRLLSMGLQQSVLKGSHIVLVDEVETGLEPHRISGLLTNLFDETSGQYILTTHSPVVLRELSINNLCVVQLGSEGLTVMSAAVPGLQSVLQGKIRSGAEAFLARKIIICEGATEVGFCRSLDRWWSKNDEASFSFHGVLPFDAGGGANVRKAAEAILSLGYSIAVVVDTDTEENFSTNDAAELRAKCIAVVDWDGGVSIEQYLFENLPWRTVLESVLLAENFHGEGLVQDRVRCKHHAKLPDELSDWVDDSELRSTIGLAALGDTKKKGSWFKRVDYAERWCSLILNANLPNDSVILRKFNVLKSWAVND